MLLIGLFLRIRLTFIFRLSLRGVEAELVCYDQESKWCTRIHSSIQWSRLGSLYLMRFLIGGLFGMTFLLTFCLHQEESCNLQMETGPGPNARVVYIDEGFDLFHSGHVEILKNARQLGVFLLVGIYTHQTVRNDIKLLSISYKKKFKSFG